MSNEEMAYIYDRYSSSVYRMAFMYCKNSADAEDITQETFISRFQTDAVFLDEKAEKAWLMRVAANKCKNMLQSARYRFWCHSVPLEDAGFIYEAPEENTVFHAVMDLPAKYRLVIHLYYYEGYSVKEIAKITSRSDTAVQTQLYRARKLLKEKLGKELQL